jgi:aspartyl protease family protein
MLVDTGATMVMISADLADRLGLSAAGGRKWKIRTANGDSVATETVLPSIDLGTIYMKDVPALIADRGAGQVNLLGASFLKRLSSVEQRNGLLVLRQ